MKKMECKNSGIPIVETSYNQHRPAFVSLTSSEPQKVLDSLGSTLSTHGGQQMKKIFVLDTNVLIHDPTSIYKFDNNDVTIPFVVIEELDSLKKGRGEIAASARQALRIIDELREKGSLSSGVTMESGGTMTVCLPDY